MASLEAQKKTLLKELKKLVTQLSSLEEFSHFEQFVQEYQKNSSLSFSQQSKEQNDIQMLLDTMKWMNQESKIQTLLDYLLDTIIQISKAERGYVIYHPKEKDELYIARNMEGKSLSDPLYQFSKNVVEKVYNTGKSIVCENALEDPLFSKFPSIQEFQLVSILCVPIFSQQEEVVGALFVENRNIENLFNESILHKVEAYSHQFALALQKSELIEENRQKAQLLAKLNKKLAEKVQRQEEDLIEANRLIDEQTAQLSERYSFHQMVGQSSVMQAVFKRMEKCAKTELSVLIFGESGTGKELAARAIHYSSTRRQKIFLAENCAGLSESVLESELFGHEKGAFTGAIGIKRGLFEQAEGGTLFLDEIGETSLNLQKKLLRVLQEGTFRRVGGEKTLTAKVRIISATNKNLAQLVEEGKFREDLFYRLSVLRVELPSLRGRKEDIEPLTQHFLREIAKQNKSKVKKIPKSILTDLTKRDWPGNVRQLYNYLQRLVAFSDGENLEPLEELEDVPQANSGLLRVEFQTIPEMVENLENQAIHIALKKCFENRTKAAELLGISRYALLRKLSKSEE